MEVRIEHLDDVLPYLPEGEGMIVRERDGFRVIDYVYQSNKTFPNDVALQCRGLKFGPDGRILARPVATAERNRMIVRF
ncbi:MAG: hypothetical protein GDA49_02975 [Rhodospirillales bacterium]|nr:hypothetical protein [Rhodospirillales bacterium]